MKQLPIDLGELLAAFHTRPDDAEAYLDTETGRVDWIHSAVRGRLDALYERASAQPPDALPDLIILLAGGKRSDPEIEALLAAAQVDDGLGSRYRRIDPGALGGRGSLEQRVRAWLAALDIEPVAIEPRPRPYRAHMLAGVLTFVRAACRLTGVTRIALLGSLSTPKPEPKDADLLVTVADDLDLAPLARLGRQLNGHCGHLNKAGDVFLADPRGRYLGRTCPWRQCGPGIRVRCDALHCGRRHYLHDDLETIRLDGALIAAPPIELWPEIVARVPVPPDVERELLQPLRDETR